MDQYHPYPWLSARDGVAVADGDGVVKTFDPAGLNAASGISTEELALPDPHHGVAIPRADGSVVLTARTTSMIATSTDNRID